MHCARVQSKLARPDSTAGGRTRVIARSRSSRSQLLLRRLPFFGPFAHPRIFPNVRVESLPALKRLSAPVCKVHTYLYELYTTRCPIDSCHVVYASSSVVREIMQRRATLLSELEVMYITCKSTVHMAYPLSHVNMIS